MENELIWVLKVPDTGDVEIQLMSALTELFCLEVKTCWR